VKSRSPRDGRQTTPGPLAGSNAAKPPEKALAVAQGALLSSVENYRTLEELAYEDIRRAIVQGKLAPGQRIRINAIAAAAGISRVPVMQALRRLETEGFVRIAPHKEAVVTELSPEETRERFLLMTTLETLCLREAAGRLTPDLLKRLRDAQKAILAARAAKDTVRANEGDRAFHALLWEVCGLKRVIQLVQNLWDHGQHYRLIMHRGRGGFAKESLEEHEAILAALERNDISTAVRALEHHRAGAQERLWENLTLPSPPRTTQGAG